MTTDHPTKEEIAEHIETLRRLYRTAEMSAAIMRDTERTGGWEGAERVARAFDSQWKKAHDAYATALRLEPMRAELEKAEQRINSALNQAEVEAERAGDALIKSNKSPPE